MNNINEDLKVIDTKDNIDELKQYIIAEAIKKIDNPFFLIKLPLKTISISKYWKRKNSYFTCIYYLENAKTRKY